MSETYAGFRRDLLHALALVEAEIDFPDEEVPDNLARTAGPVLDRLIEDLRRAIDTGRRGERVRDGYRIVLIGETNAGKSSLFNALIAREAAIVTPIAGTTRDVLDAELVIGGYAVTLSDTAGLRESDDPVEAEGVRRARARGGAGGSSSLGARTGRSNGDRRRLCPPRRPDRRGQKRSWRLRFRR